MTEPSNDYSSIGLLVAKAQELLDRIKGGAIRTMQTQWDALMAKSTQSVNDFLTQKRAEFSGVLNTVETQAFPYINLFKNSYAREKSSENKWLFPISSNGLAELEEVVAFEDLPAAVKVAYEEKYKNAFGEMHGYRPNALHVRFPEGVKPTYWIPGNYVYGKFSAGFALAYVARGSMAGIEAGQSGGVIQRLERRVGWHIDATYRGSEGLEVYLFAPFVVAGHCPSEELVQYVSETAAVLDGNIA